MWFCAGQPSAATGNSFQGCVALGPVGLRERCEAGGPLGWSLPSVGRDKQPTGLVPTPGGLGPLRAEMASEPVPPSVASVASVSAADGSWALKTAGGEVDLTRGEHTRSGWSLKEIREKLGEAFNSAVKQHGGPMQFLMHRYPNTQTKEQYAKRLWQEFPPLHSHPPHLGWLVPSVAVSERTANSEVVWPSWTSHQRPR